MSTPDIDEQNGEDTLKDDVPTPSATLFVSNFDHHATEDDLNSVFSRFDLEGVSSMGGEGGRTFKGGRGKREERVRGKGEERVRGKGEEGVREEGRNSAAI